MTTLSPVNAAGYSEGTVLESNAALESNALLITNRRINAVGVMPSRSACLCNAANSTAFNVVCTTCGLLFDGIMASSLRS